MFTVIRNTGTYRELDIEYHSLPSTNSWDKFPRTLLVWEFPLVFLHLAKVIWT